MLVDLFRALAFRQTPKWPTLVKSALETLYDGQFTLSIQLIKLNYFFYVF